MGTELDLAIAAIALGSINATLHLLLGLAGRGLIDARDIDAIAHSLTAPLDELSGSEAAEQFRAILEAKISPILAQIYEVARRTEGRREAP